MNKENNNIIDSYIAFWRPDDPYNYMGQWYVSDFKFNNDDIINLPNYITSLSLYTNKINVVNKLGSNIIYNSAEKFMMMGKAALFDDDFIFNKMLNTDSPKTQKALGRKVKNFDEHTWNAYNKDIVILGNYLKFSQNEILKNNLESTKSKVLIEGSPLDKIWGVGLRFDDPDIQYKNKWKGTNYLGECLEYVRDHI